MKSLAAAHVDVKASGDPFARTADALLEKLGAERADAVVLFASWHLQPRLEAGLAEIRDRTGATVVVGGGAYGVISGEIEVEQSCALAAVAVRSDTMDFAAQFLDLREGSAQAAFKVAKRWMDDEDSTRAGVVISDPRDFDADAFVHEFEQTCGSRTLVGGLASGEPSDTDPLEICGTRAAPNHLAALLVRGGVRCETVVTTCCEPIGPALPVSEVDDNRILRLGERTPLEVLQQIVQSVPGAAEAARTGNIFGGYAIDAHKPEPGRGDYLIRSLVSLDHESGALGLVQKPCIGRPFSFQRRAPAVAIADFAERLDAARESLGGRPPLFGLYFDCMGRGRSLYGESGMDIQIIRKHLGVFPLAGFHGNGEIGPGGGRTLLLNYSGVLALFVEES